MDQQAFMVRVSALHVDQYLCPSALRPVSVSFYTQTSICVLLHLDQYLCLSTLRPISVSFYT